VELYTPAHDYIFRGRGVVIGSVEEVIAYRAMIVEHPLIEAEQIKLEL